MREAEAQLFLQQEMNARLKVELDKEDKKSADADKE
jgi:hypothetical protein